ncbi:unnamed protein product [Didymodactylos carnosus]|uniref:Uncharacterized protein n=1 Tax=Didymodactylos carnosus TaxID=1234261 RepID=A0A816AV90_9BILA|nr:unnamed protein product [Didymodactylos carnosus]CAF4481308.1 unnamed protein product [Didymodactylos carnosus]
MYQLERLILLILVRFHLRQQQNSNISQLRNTDMRIFLSIPINDINIEDCTKNVLNVIDFTGLCTTENVTSNIIDFFNSKKHKNSLRFTPTLFEHGRLLLYHRTNRELDRSPNLIEARKDLSKLHESHKQEVTELRKHFEEKLADCDTRATAYVASKMSPKHI